MSKTRFFVMSVLVALPWLNPFVPEPSQAVVPWLVSLGCAGALLLAVPGRKPPQRGTLFFMFLCGFFLLHWRLQGGRYGAELMGLLAALTVLWVSLATGLGMAKPADRRSDTPAPKTHAGALHWLTLTWLAAALISCALGLLQYFGWAKSLSPWVNQTLDLGEAVANLRQRNQLATLTSMGLLALLAVLGQPRQLERGAPGIRFLGWTYGAMALLALGNAATGSRTGLLQWLLVLACTAWWGWSARRRVVVFALQAVLVYVAAAVALPLLLGMVSGMAGEGLFDRFTEAQACLSRKVLWSNVLTLIVQKPWLGWGWGELDYAHFMAFFPDSRFCQILDNGHNLPLHIAVELGIPAALAVCGFAVWVLWRAKPWRETDPLRQMVWGVLAVIMMHSLLEFPLWYGVFQITFGLCIGVLWGASAQVSASGGTVLIKEEKKSILAPAGKQKFAVVWAAICLTMLVSATISYDHVRQIYLPLHQRSSDYQEDTLRKVQNTWLFPDQARFALLMSISTINADNAAAVYSLAKELLHYSPEAPVVERLIEAAAMLGHEEEVQLYKARFHAAFPEEYAEWFKKIP